MLGGLRTRFRSPSVPVGFIALIGPRGAGGTRVLEELEAGLVAEGRRTPLRVYAQPEDERVPLGALRDALAEYLGHLTPPRGLRLLRTLLTGSDAEVDVLAGWLFGVRLEETRIAPDPQRVGDLIERLLPVGPILVDRFDELDQASQEVLLASAIGPGPAVVAVMQTARAEVPEENRWVLEPLTDSQIELMLRRWIKHAATSRRLAAGLVGPTGGLPGRIVRAVRTLAALGVLGHGPRGICFLRDPGVWPGGSDEAVLEEDPGRLDPTQREIHDLAAVMGGQPSAYLLAEAAGVKQAVVREMLDEAAASRGGRAPNSLFGSKAAQAAWLRALPHERVQSLRATLIEAGRRGSPTPGDHVLLAAVASDLCRYEDAIRFLSAAEPRHVRLPDLRAQLARGAKHFDSEVVSEDLREKGAAWVRRLLGPSGGRRADVNTTPRAGVPARVRAALEGRAHLREREIEELRERIGEAAQDRGDLPARLLQAEFEIVTGEFDAARSILREIGHGLAPADLPARAAWHMGLATLAARTGRPHAQSAHLRRLSRLARALGRHHRAAQAWMELGEIELSIERVWRATTALARAAFTYRIQGDAEREIQARLRLGECHASCLAFDRGAAELGRALELCETPQTERYAAEAHLLLALVHRGRGDLVLERMHATRAGHLATTARLQMRAAAILATADLRAGARGAMRALERLEADLRASGLEFEAREARSILLDARLRQGQPEPARELIAFEPESPLSRLGRARLDLALGRDREALEELRLLTGEARLPVDIRLQAHVHLADALRRQGRLPEARQAAIVAAALLEIRLRSRIEDLRMHRILSRVFQACGAQGRSLSHRFAARRALRRLVRAAASPHEGRRLARQQWRTDRTIERAAS